jgi:hypothetical protein
MESGESIIGTKGGVIEARDFRRKPVNGGRWNVEDFNSFVGVPWDPYPGAGGGYEIKSKVRLPINPDEFAKTVRGQDDYVPKRIRIKKGDLEKYGYTVGARDVELRPEGGQRPITRRSADRESLRSWRKQETSGSPTRRQGFSSTCGRSTGKTEREELTGQRKRRHR